MPVTSIADIIDPEVLADQIGAKFPDKLVLANSGLIDTSGEFPIGTPGTEFEIPFWKRIAAFADIAEGVAMTPQKIQAGKEHAIVKRGGGAYQVYDTAKLVSYADPMAEVSGQISEQAARYLDNYCVTTAQKSPNLFDYSSGTGTLDKTAISRAMISKLGDNHQNLLAGGGAIIVHSKCYGDLVETSEVTDVSKSGIPFVVTGAVGSILGLPIIISDRVTTSTSGGTTFYNNLIVGKGALALFYQRGVLVEFDRDILLQMDTIAATVHFAPHLYGWDFKADTQAAEDAKSIRVIRLKTK